MTTKGKNLREGQRFQLEVSENVMLGGFVVIPAGTPAVGEVTDVRNKGMWGKSGKINARALYVRLNGRQFRLRGQGDDKGVAGGIAATAVSAIVFLPAGFFMTGTSAKIPIGAPMVAFLDEDIQFAIAAGPISGPQMAQPTQMVAVGPATSYGSDIVLVPAKTLSGYCIRASADYRGTGSKGRPVITSAMPRCN